VLIGAPALMLAVAACGRDDMGGVVASLGGAGSATSTTTTTTNAGEAAQRRTVRRWGGRDRLGARARLAGQRPAGLPERVQVTDPRPPKINLARRTIDSDHPGA
jgi:hypothetical protein